MELACVEIFLLSHRGFTDGFLLLVIPHSAWQSLAVGNYLLSLYKYIYIYLFSSREEQFNLERPSRHIIGVTLFLFLFPCQGKEVMHPLWVGARCWMSQLPEQVGGQPLVHCDPQGLQPHLRPTPAPVLLQGSHVHALL